MLRRTKRRRSSAWVSKSASTKISTVSSLAWFDADRRIAEIDFVPATVVSSNDRVRHLGFAPLTRPVLLAALIAATNLGIIVRLIESRSPWGMSINAAITEAPTEAAGVRFFPDRRNHAEQGIRHQEAASDAHMRYLSPVLVAWS
jgi:hypothetical protein